MSQLNGIFVWSGWSNLIPCTCSLQQLGQTWQPDRHPPCVVGFFSFLKRQVFEKKILFKWLTGFFTLLCRCLAWDPSNLVDALAVHLGLTAFSAELCNWDEWRQSPPWGGEQLTDSAHSCNLILCFSADSSKWHKKYHVGWGWGGGVKTLMRSRDAAMAGFWFWI